jgi:hypothetical protein
MAKLTEWEAAMLEKLVGDEMVRARESGQPFDLLNDLAALRDTLLRADALHAETFRDTLKALLSSGSRPARWPT